MGGPPCGFGPMLNHGKGNPPHRNKRGLSPFGLGICVHIYWQPMFANDLLSFA
jgi:hypothetical protein